MRLRLVSIGIIIAALVFAVKLYLLQVVHHDNFVMLGDRQYVKRGGKIFSRGSIYFEDKRGNLISAATLKTGYLLTINPTLVVDKEGTYSKLSEVVELDMEKFLVQASKELDTYEEVAERIPEDKALAIKAKKIPGVSLYKEQWRFYPGDRSASNVVGLLGYKDDDYGGRYGLESFYDNALRRDTGNSYANFFVEIFSSAKKVVSEDEAFEGDLVATIEPTVQAALEDAVAKIHSNWNSYETGAIIMDPKTGEIYAMATLPNFSPNDFSGEKDPRVFSNPLVEKVYEMGSIIKPLTVASGIDAGVITPTTTYEDKGYVISDTETIRNHDKKAHGLTSIQEVLNKSLNTGVMFVTQKLGNKKLAEYMLGFGLGEKTGVDLPNEAQNIVSNLKGSRSIGYLTASFGQGIALTPISTIRALAALGNGGMLVSPHVIRRVNYTTGFVKTTPISEGKRVISPETSSKITGLLVNVVDTALLGGKAKNEHYSVAAKTGTAQIARENGGGYYDDRYLHSFMGYFPAYEPKFIILLYTYDPKTNLFAGDTLARPFLDLSKFLLSYYEVPPDR